MCPSGWLIRHWAATVSAVPGFSPTKSSGTQLRLTIICVKYTIYLSSLLNTAISFFLGGKDEAGTWRMGATDTEKEKKVMATGSQTLPLPWLSPLPNPPCSVCLSEIQCFHLTSTHTTYSDRKSDGFVCEFETEVTTYSWLSWDIVEKFLYFSSTIQNILKLMKDIDSLNTEHSCWHPREWRRAPLEKPIVHKDVAM